MERTVPIRILDFIDVGLVLMGTNNGDLMDCYCALLPKDTKIGHEDFNAFEKISDKYDWGQLLQFEKKLIEEGMWE